MPKASRSILTDCSICSVACRPLKFGRLERTFQVPAPVMPSASRQLAYAVRLATLRNRLGLCRGVGPGSRCTGPFCTGPLCTGPIELLEFIEWLVRREEFEWACKDLTFD